VLVDMLRNSKFDAGELEREKGVILEEMNMYMDTPRDYVGSVYEELVFGSNPLGWETLGTRETIEAATRETFLDYIGHWYRPERMVVGIAGRLEGDVRGEVERLFGDLEPAATGEPARVQPLATNGKPRVHLHTKQSDQAHLVLGVRSRELTHPDRYILQVLATILGGGMSSRLFTEVRERRGLAYYVFGVNQSYTDAGSLYSQAGVDLNRIDEAVTTIAAELRRVAEEPIPEAELDKAKNFAKGRFVLQLENPQGLILFGLRREVLEGGAVEPDEVLAAIDAVTLEDVQRVAREVIGEQQFNLALVGPFDDPERFERLLEG
jgi:predicted Zn-dependent peptidase